MILTTLGVIALACSLDLLVGEPRTAAKLSRPHDHRHEGTPTDSDIARGQPISAGKTVAQLGRLSDTARERTDSRTDSSERLEQVLCQLEGFLAVVPLDEQGNAGCAGDDILQVDAFFGDRLDDLVDNAPVSLS